MSLNGLDDQRLTEAYQGALAEAGGWFLLKYVSRDAVEVLARGTGGAAEARGTIAQYEDKSPLYGFLLYRRRKVLIKYVPEGTSRLLQARVAVHFEAVKEKVTPHDAIIAITTADELSDAALTSACSLHTAVPSSCSSSGSSRLAKLDEITEDAEEASVKMGEAASSPQAAAAGAPIPTVVEPPVAQEPGNVEVPETAALKSPMEDTETTPTAASTPALGRVPTETTPEEKSEFQPASIRNSLKDYDGLFVDGPDPRMSSQTARPTYSELYEEYYAQYTKPKVKLGPRPRPSLDTKRPHTSGAGSQTTARPVSSLPAGMRAGNRKTMEPKRPKSRDSSIVPSIAFPPPPPVPSIPDMSMSMSNSLSKSSVSVRSMPMGLPHRQSTATSEKQRLAKALELRKKQMKARKEKEEQRKADEADAEANAKIGHLVEHVLVEEGSTMEPAADEVSATMQPQHDDENATHDATKSPVTLQDSGVDMIGSQTENDDMHSAASASSPTSAQTQGSSAAPSTRPSSVSEEDIYGQELKPSDPEEPRSPDLVEPESSLYEDEHESVESSPTVVPENSTPVPSVRVYADSESQAETLKRASVSDDALVRRNKRESMVFMSPSDNEESQSQRRSKRESMLFMPSSGGLEMASRGEKRESHVPLAAKRMSFFEVKEKRRALTDPVQIHLSAENSEAEYLSDDSFMEELQSATLEQAQPMSVSKSPITQFFPRKTSISEISVAGRSERSVSQYKPDRLSPKQVPGRKSSGLWPPVHANTDPMVPAKKINVSSGISQRIKALAEKSNRDSTASVSPLTTPDASASIVAQRKSSFFSSTPSPGGSPPGKAIKRLSRASFGNLLNSPTPDKMPVLQPPPSRDGKQTVYNVQQEPAKPESVQVTARIVRDPRTQKPTLTMPNQNTPLDLHQSPITIDHTRSRRPSSSAKHSPIKTSEPQSPRPPSSSHSREQSGAALPRSSSESSWRSFGRRMSESRPAPRSQSAHSTESSEEKREEKKEKRDSRTSKLFKRMSTLSSISRKNSVNTLQEEDAQLNPMPSLPSLREPPPAVQVGDLNVQFPDTLLWKRRWVEVDASGNLVLSLSRSNESSKGITKRFHLSEFRTPYAPDQDRQELPNSVVLDFLDGRTLQCACETYLAQVQVLQILREAHDAWLAYGQFQ
ncbi:hypothetical protein P154DRAFT_427133 [Amniculicola lignicola CBS 123094]|uniref:ADF-H domain-containing protein n=1 Tax=Amniculicola lignicola CBS 123094 TaxID=1392246 RepID=A0A6A5WR08_9PLEO|nr:hypothetical protein P154DRAFT_427133 [Amniculicola lignicola CBS 123094]